MPTTTTAPATELTSPLFDVLPPAALGAAPSHLELTLDPVVVTAIDDASARPGWSATTQLRRALAAVDAALTGADGLSSGEAGDDASGAWSVADGQSTRDASSIWTLHGDQLRVDYRAPFGDEAALIMARATVHALRELSASDVAPEALDIVDPAERALMLGQWNRTTVARQVTDTVHGLFSRIAREHAASIAIEESDRAITYAELDDQANRVAGALIARGVGVGQCVALLMDRSADAIVALLGVLKAGAAYLPLDPLQPAGRLAFVANDAKAALIVRAEGSEPLAGADAPVVSLAGLFEGELLPTPVVFGNALAYVMYTSGSTGTPKGVEIPHRGIIRLVRGVDYVDFGMAPRMLHAAPLGFDASTLEIWGALLNAGTVIVHPEKIPTGAGLAATIRHHDARIAWLTAALFNAVVDEDPTHLRGLGQLLTGGEALSPNHIRKAYAALDEIVLINGYGPTECTTFATTWRIPRDLADTVASIPIGRPIADTTLYVLGARGQMLPVGAIGELYIGGAGVARGYLARPELTAERFVPDTQGPGSGRLYRTGDLVRWLADGSIEFIGRADGQVKIRGYRIEVGEIEAALLRLDGVRACAVVPMDDRGQKRLVAYYVASKPSADARSLRASLAETLPDFMLPSAWMRLDALPITANGKLDRRALPAPDAGRPELADDYMPANGQTEARLCAIFAEILGIESVGRNDHFFDLGGNSLLAVKTLARVHAELSTRPSIVDFFGEPTPAALGALIDGVVAQAIPPVTSAGAALAEPIAIIAMAGRFPGARNVEAFWENLCEGRESITFFGPGELDPAISDADINEPSYVAARGIIDGVEDFDAGFFGMSPREAELTDPQQRVFLELCWECLERAGHVPDNAGGTVGVFAGMHNATYFQKHLAHRPDLIDKLGAFQVMLANEKDYIATRVAHKLNLNGPAVSLNTACSTSLVAICQAFDALRLGHCDMALAGGSSIACPPRSGYVAQEGSMLSPDGHTRSFDIGAQGTVFSDGSAVVLLKRLADALRDGDPIIAVMRGGAVNNDGGIKASFTAPSAAGQAAVITRALDVAGVDARSISYVETHGTATPLGDPIEIEGLSRAYRRYTKDAAFCAIGSLKSNVGHLVMAAGAAGVIKTALSLATRQLPPSLHFTANNPRLGLEGSPFVVNGALREWTCDGVLRAGVSSFGVGGTNAHAILEEAPAREASTQAEGPQLLVLSARSEAALQAAVLNLGDHLAMDPAINLADAAHTLAVGRKVFAHRTHVVAADATEAVERLAAATFRKAAAQEPGIVLMFPGQGSQYAGMGRALHATDAAFRDALDACAQALQEELGFDLRERMFADDVDALRETGLTQPATFAIEYALGRAWMARGIKPVAMLGHSVGEFTAAVLAGVMSLEDGARLVARRGRMMQALPAGNMLSVKMAAADLERMLSPALSLAAENAPTACVVSGPADAIAQLQSRLEADGVACRALHTSHAFHSSMMDPALGPFAAEVAAIRLATPSIRMVSTLTGDTLTDAEAISADYWTRHLRGTVRFSSAVASLLEEPGLVFVDAGPRGTLGSLTRMQKAARGRVVVASLGDTPAGEQAAWLDAAGSLWAAGVFLDIASLDTRACKQRIRLPTYPFERKRHWVDAIPALRTSLEAASIPAAILVPAPIALPEPVMSVQNSQPNTSPGRASRLIGQLTALFEDVSGADMDDVDPTSSFMELGLDSLSLTQVALQLQKTFALKITFRELMESCPTFDSLARHIDRLLPPEAAPAVAAAAAAPTASVTGPAAAMAMSAASMPAAASGNLVQDVIAQQMAIMQQQLALLAGAPMAAPAVVAAAPVATAPVQAAAAPAASAASAAMLNTPAPAANDGQDEEAALAHTSYDVKKAFGAIARIHSGHTELTARQRARLEAFTRRYIERTKASKAYTQEHRDHLADPRVVNGFRPLLKEIIYQVVVGKSKGSRVWDLDGNEYVDALNGFGMNLFGWQPDFVVDAVRKQLDEGYEIGPQHPLAGVVAKQVCELTGFDRAALCNTGSEAVMGTVRIARTVTGRDTLVIFTGSYHGIFDEVIVRGTKKLRSVPAAPGILKNTSENVLVLDYGTPESLAIIRERASSIAAVLVEPVQSRRPDFQPREFLQELRAITADAGALLIFDEVVTGFRSHPRGAQSVLGIDADLASYGKVVGGGFPIGVIAGKRKFMDALDGGGWQFGDASIPTVGVTYFAGTFVRHPLALAAAHAVLTHLAEEGGELQKGLNGRTTAMIDELNAFCTAVGAPIKLTHFASVWKVNFMEEHPLQDLLFAMMRSRGIHVLDNFPCFFTTAHSASDFATIATAFRESVLELQEAEFLPRRIDVRSLDADNPPVAGARLGKDEKGNPAWFVPNPEAPGKYMRVSA
ncbi:amino acid adenylation domain-containing protein [Pinirhizobacter sp.]|uniref:amino acid adenylation domain-containing protein n=1 Tax=Pinirhizobacter sp. TaxID=2950432 RepID=UPI002F410837